MNQQLQFFEQTGSTLAVDVPAGKLGDFVVDLDEKGLFIASVQRLSDGWRCHVQHLRRNETGGSRHEETTPHGAARVAGSVIGPGWQPP